MTHKLAEKWADYMILNGAVEAERDIYVYGLECTLNELISDVILLAAAGILHRFWQMLCWIAVFNLFRIHVGGYHANTPARCLFGSTVTGIACVMIYPGIQDSNRMLPLLLILDAFIIWEIAPVLHPNHPVSDERRNLVKKRARMLAVVFGLLTFLTKTINPDMAALLCITETCACMLSLAGKMKIHIMNN